MTRPLFLPLLVLAALLLVGCDREPAEQFEARGAAPPTQKPLEPTPTPPPTPTAPASLPQLELPDLSIPDGLALIGARANDDVLLYARLGAVVSGEMVAGLIGGQAVPGSLLDDKVLDRSQLLMRSNPDGVMFALHSQPGALEMLRSPDVTGLLPADQRIVMLGKGEHDALVGPRDHVASVTEALSSGSRPDAAVQRGGGFETASLWMRLHDAPLSLDGQGPRADVELALFTSPDLRIVARITNAPPGSRARVEALMKQLSGQLAKALPSLSSLGIDVAQAGEDLTTLHSLLQHAMIADGGDAVVVTLSDAGGEQQVERWTRLLAHLALRGTQAAP